ncbi:phage antirepressor N-terminal domain-containing protein [Rodentibacter pneumotropicus]|uniref:phage antirepressor N-terminal domain-containing protein n=1 Tax=Rodentibacter pneumotropicus TaxID=758 RepID=UPI002352388A|nr:phage antirepressor N-terminal domain-containing protein [Rodentibacter pneumotropicus]
MNITGRQPYVAMKQVVEELGLDWKGQYDKLNQPFSRGMVISPIPSNGGIQDTVCMSLRKFPAWLYTLNPKKMPIHKRGKVMTYQEECFETLYNNWHFGKAERKTPTDERTGLR